MEMATKVFRKEMEYKQFLTGNNDSGSTGNGDQPREGYTDQRVKSTDSEK